MKDIKGYEGLYAITSCGRVWSYRSKKFLKPSVDRKGYMRVQLYKNGTKKTIRIHKLVAEAYIPNPDNLDTVDHIDGNKEHNYIRNLQWMSCKENVRKAQSEKLYCIETGEVFNSVADAAKSVDRTHSAISQSIKKGTKCGGYHWVKID